MWDFESSGEARWVIGAESESRQLCLGRDEIVMEEHKVRLEELNRRITTKLVHL